MYDGVIQDLIDIVSEIRKIAAAKPSEGCGALTGLIANQLLKTKYSVKPGASLEGSYLDPDNDWNALYYGSGANTKAIVLDRRFTNPGAEPIRQFMAKW